MSSDNAERNSEFDSDSELSEEEEEDSVLLPFKIRDFLSPTVQTLSGLVKKFPNIPQEQQNLWSRTVSYLIKHSTVPSYRYGLLGKTGAGVGHCNPLSASLIFWRRACTAAVTEITYADSDDISAKIVFKSKAEWGEELGLLLDDIKSNPEDDSSEPSKSIEKLLLVYPQYGLAECTCLLANINRLRNKDISTLTPAHLLKLDPVRHRLGTSSEVSPSDPDNFRTNLEEYLSSSTGNFETAVLWPLVSKVEVCGRFPVLSSGIVLVDLPGHGDDDDARNDSAIEYIKKADGVILVTDVKRAQNDRETLSYLRKTLNQIIIDENSIEDFVVLAATGTDNPIGDNDIRLEGDAQLKLDQINKELKDIRLKDKRHSTNSPNKAKTKEGKAKEGKTKERKPKAKDGNSKQRGKQLNARDDTKIRELEHAKALLFANARIDRVKGALHEFFRKLNSGLAPPENELPRLPIFCVGSQDFLKLEANSTPYVFFDQDETEIPKLMRHLQVIGEPLISDLEKTNLEEAKGAFEAIEDEVGRVKDALKKATKKAAEGSPQVVTGFGAIHWNTYKACMHFNGVYYAYDMNRDLTREILPSIQGSWNGGINHKIPLTLKEATAKMEENVLNAITDIIDALNGQGTAFEQQIDAARRCIGVEGLLSDMSAVAIQNITLAQRDGTRSFHTVIQKELTPQYQWSFQQSGPGSFARMKKSNVSHLEQNGEDVFHSIDIHIGQLLDDAIKNIKRNFQNELRSLTTLLRLSLVEDVNLSKDHKEVKDRIIQITLDNRPAIATRKLDLSDQERRLENELSKQWVPAPL
ncbi:hypothetical protein MVEN_01508600 [Mycena venus]|uniref:Uncharacterized protein n=1 Tax=Mycena venus TaxID=2733690 RepID=A0A8H6XW53_9AGAR|nr:hypothetical protein MVEN_01508600 [Mycena venus]